MLYMQVRDKHIQKLVKALEDAGLEVSRTKGKQHVRVRNPKTGKIVFFGAASLVGYYGDKIK
jgi:predicted RNA binding protein YcfA (HicA-like mRNA interferase family)